MRADLQTPGNEKHILEHRATGDVSAPKETNDRERLETSEPDALQLLLKQLGELGEYFSYYLTAKADSAKLSLRNIGIWIAVGTLGFVAVAGLIITASWLLLIGIAQGLGVLFGDRPWVGNVMTGFLLLAGLGIGIYCTVARRKKTSRERTIGEYEKRQARQRKEFGRDVADHAAATPSEAK